MSYADKKEATRNQNRWISEKYDRINLTVPKGQKDVLQAYAQWHGISVNGLIGRLIEDELNRNPALLRCIMDEVERKRADRDFTLLEEEGRPE